MKNLIKSVLMLAILGSCTKEAKEVENTIPDPPEGIYEVIFYDQHNDVVFRGKGTTFYIVVNNCTQIRLDNPQPIQTSGTNPDEVAYILFQLNYKLSSPAIVDTSGFYGYVAQGWYTSDWDYKIQTGELRITDVVLDKIRGEFTACLVYANSPNPNWGDRFTIKGKFCAPCGGYGC